MVQGAVPPAIKAIILKITATGFYTFSQAVRAIIEESPRVKAAMKNGSRKKAEKR